MDDGVAQPRLPRAAARGPDESVWPQDEWRHDRSLAERSPRQLKLRHRGGARVNWNFIFTAAVFNLVRMRTLLAQPDR